MDLETLISGGSGGEAVILLWLMDEEKWVASNELRVSDIDGANVSIWCIRGGL